MPFKGHERRKSNQDRRQNPRSGKLDRRRNHCFQCRYYAPQSDVAGVCQKHQTMIRADDYACVFFVETLNDVTPPPTLAPADDHAPDVDRRAPREKSEKTADDTES